MTFGIIYHEFAESPLFLAKKQKKICIFHFFFIPLRVILTNYGYIVRKLTSVLFICFALLQSVSAASKLSPDKHHFLGAWGAVGYSGLMQTTDVKPGIGVSPSLGLGYRFLYNGFVLQLGVEGQYHFMTNRLANINFSLPMLDTEGERFTMFAHIYNERDYMHAANIAIPLSVGFERKYLYFLAGAKFSLNLYGECYSKSKLETKGVYDRFIENFERMDNHQFYKNHGLESDRYTMSLNPSLNLQCEIGSRVDQIVFEKGADVPQHNYRMYLGLFAEYGLLNVHKNVSKGEQVAYRQTDSEGVQFYVIPAMVSDKFASAKVHPLMVGVRFSVFFAMPEPKTCVICNEMKRKQNTQHYNSHGRVAW